MSYGIYSLHRLDLFDLAAKGLFSSDGAWHACVVEVGRSVGSLSPDSSMHDASVALARL